MKTNLLLSILSIASFANLSTAQAQVPPPIISYQGRVAVGNVNFTGPGQFKVALVNGAGTISYWSNDGTSAAGSQTTSAVTVNVASGLYTLPLGDTTLMNMTTIPPSVFINSDVRVRVWFNDGTHGFQLLSPDRRVASVGYAFVAGELNMPATTGPSVGVITQNGAPLLHSYGSINFFAGGAGNFTMTGGSNTAVGRNALKANTTGWSNTSEGVNSLAANTTGYGNVATGVFALSSNTTGYVNVAYGISALSANTTGTGNTAFGANTLAANVGGDGNVASGANALSSNTNGSGNTADGSSSLTSNTTGGSNTAVGVSALQLNTTGSNNIAVGSSAGMNLTTGNSNIDIGNQGVAGESGIIRIGTPGTHSDTYLSGVVHGNGSGLTNLTASNITPGSITTDRLSQEYAVFEERMPSGTSPALGIAGWNTRAIGSAPIAISGTSITLVSSNAFTLQPGVYFVDAECPAVQVDLHQAAIFDTSNSTTAVLVGSSAQSRITNASGPHYSTSNVSGYITVSSSPHTYQLRHFLTGGTELGRAVSSGQVEVYARIHIRRVR